MPTPIIPVKSLSTSDILYGDRVTSYRWEVFKHVGGVDQLVGVLDGVSDGSLTWTQNVSVKGAGKVTIVDLDVAQAGMLRIADVATASARLRPVCVINGLPETPLGIFLLTAAGEGWDDTGRTWSFEMLDKCTVPDQEDVDQSYAVAAGTLILAQVATILASCGESIVVDNSNTAVTASNMVWDVGTSKLKIINDLLAVANYNSLWMDGIGNFQATPSVLPANRSVNYDILSIPRELRDGEQGIYKPQWSRDKDSYDVPNKVIAIEAADGADTAALVGSYTNADPTSPYSTVTRGRTITATLDGVDVPDGTDASKITFLNSKAQASLIAQTAVQATVKVDHLPIPIRVSDVMRFANLKAGVDGKYVVTGIQLDATPLGMMQSTLQEVISL